MTNSIDDILAADADAGSRLIDLPQVDTADADRASVEYSQHRTKLSTHRTALSTHRTELSEHRTALSTHRTELSEHRTALSTRRTDMSTDRTEMSRRRTGMSFQRTRMSAERTLMSVVRTALSLISFGFTIFQFFQHLQQQKLLDSSHAARNFGLALVYLGVGMLVTGIAYHVQFMLGLRHERKAMTQNGLVHAQSRFPVSFTLIAAVLLLVLGLVAGSNLTFRIGPFG